MGRILGLDVGDKTIGIALSDELKWTAQGVMTLQREGRKKDIPALLEFAAANDVEEIVIGLPKNMNNTIGERAELVMKFARRLEAQLPRMKIALWDERLTTVAANNMLIEADVSRKKRKKTVDAIAAALILQGYLDARSISLQEDPF